MTRRQAVTSQRGKRWQCRPAMSVGTMCDEIISRNRCAMDRPGFSASFGQERLTGDGAVQINRRQLALLHGLLDRPNCSVNSYSQWVRAALPYLANRSPGAVMSMSLGPVYQLPTTWVSRTRTSAGVAVQLLPRGRDILELKVLSHIRGHGVYRGLRNLRRER